MFKYGKNKQHTQKRVNNNNIVNFLKEFIYEIIMEIKTDTK